MKVTHKKRDFGSPAETPMSTEEKVARWVFKVSFLDEDETWNSMMLEDLIIEVRRIIKTA